MVKLFSASGMMIGVIERLISKPNFLCGLAVVHQALLSPAPNA